MKVIRAIDLFCGAGGSSYGARNAGAEIVAGFDYWQPAIATYKENFINSETWNADIREVDVQFLKDRLGKIDLILLVLPNAPTIPTPKEGATGAN